MLTYELTRWLAYRKIHHPQMKFYVWYVPIFMTTVLTAVYLLMPLTPPLVGPTGLLLSIVSILSILPGFFISALAAVATFNRPEMDEAMPLPTPTVTVFRSGKYIDIDLTRRTFLTYVFSYLSIMSLLATTICVAAQYLSSNWHAVSEKADLLHYGSLVNSGLHVAFVIVISYIFSSIIVTTLHGIFFLTEVIHLP